MAPGKTAISCFMITFNNARTVEKALRSAAWVDEIVVVDSFSTDGTPEIARKCGAKVSQRPWPGFRDQYQFAAESCAHDWVLYLDADEEVTPELAAALRAALAQNVARPEPEQVRGFSANRCTWYLGRWILHGAWAPASDCETRLYDRRQGRWLGDLHATVRGTGRVTNLRGLINHYSYKDIADQLRKLDLYSATAADDNRRAGKSFSLLRMLFEPGLRFMRDYLLKAGFLDGLPGFVIAANTMFYVFIKQAKLWELERREDKTKACPSDTVQGARGMGRRHPPA